MKYRPEIDGLRAVAVLPVLFFHAGFDAFRGGFVGVDVFFVISGYLITRIIVERLDRGRFTLRDFYERRARRILPMIAVVCVASAPAAWFLLRPSEFVDFSWSVVAANTFWANVFFWSQSGYFAPPVEFSPLVHTWSLSVEEQFYLLFPVGLIVVRRWSRRWQFGVFTAVVLVSFAGSVYGAYRHPGANFYLLPSRAWELGVGALLGLAAANGSKLLERGHEGLAIMGTVLIGIGVFAFDETTPFPSHFALLPVLGTALVIGAATPRTIVGRALSARWMVAIGLMSYSLYLWHQPVLAFLKVSTYPDPSLVQVVAALALAFGLSALTFACVETPFRNRRWISGRGVWVSAVASTVVLTTAGLLASAAQGWPQASERRMALAALDAGLKPNHGLSPTCEGEFTLDPECRNGEAPRVVVWGDSYAMHLMDGILADLPGAEVIQHTKSVCGPTLGLAPVRYPDFPPAWARGCLDFNQAVFDWLRQAESVEVVVLSSPWAHYWLPGWRQLTPSGEFGSDRERLLVAFRQTLRAIEELGVQPVVVSPPPRHRSPNGEYHDLAACFSSVLRRDADRTSCDFTTAEYSAGEAELIDFLQEIEVDYPVVWLPEAMCDAGSCRVMRDGVLMYGDIGHLTRAGSRLLGMQFDLFSGAIRGAPGEAPR